MRENLRREAEYWGNCVNTWVDEFKQMHYAVHMGIVNDYGSWPKFDLGGKSVIDLGGGPVSMLLKTKNTGRLTVVDPAPYPPWVRARYVSHGIQLLQVDAESYRDDHAVYDECWIYNTLQHTVNPADVARVARRSSRRIRVFEWLEIEADDLHPHVLTLDGMNEWFEMEGEPVFGVNTAWGEDGEMAWTLS